MKKFTLMMVAALLSFTGVYAQDGASVDTLYYTLVQSGSWSEDDAQTTSSGNTFYRTWVSDDSIVTITFDGFVFDFQNMNADYLGYFNLYPGDITFTCKEGYHVDSLFWQGGAVGAPMSVKLGDETLVSLDTTTTEFSWIEVFDTGGANPFVLTIEGDGAVQMYNNEFNYGFFAVSGSPTTGITGVTTEKKALKDDAWYDLTGRRVATPRKGIYIRNGKKFVVK